MVRKVLLLVAVLVPAVFLASACAEERTGDDGFVWAMAFDGRISPLGLACLSAYQPYAVMHARERVAGHAFETHRHSCDSCRRPPAVFRDWVEDTGSLCPTGAALLAVADAFTPDAVRRAEIYDAARREWELELSSARRRCEDLKNEALNCESAYRDDAAAQQKADELRAKKSIDAAAYGRILAQYAEACRRLPFNPDERVGEGPDASTRYAVEIEALDRQLGSGELTPEAAVPKYVSQLTVLIRARELEAARDAAFADLYFQLIALCDEVAPVRDGATEESPARINQEEVP